MKLSAAQQRVVELMQDGWELRPSKATGIIYMYGNPQGNFTPRERVTWGTLKVLREKNVIESVGDEWRTYRLAAPYRKEQPNGSK